MKEANDGHTMMQRRVDDMVKVVESLLSELSDAHARSQRSEYEVASVRAEGETQSIAERREAEEHAVCGQDILSQEVNSLQ